MPSQRGTLHWRSKLVGSTVLPVLGAVPDGAIVLFSGMGPREEVAESLGVGIGALGLPSLKLQPGEWCEIEPESVLGVADSRSLATS